MQSGITLVALVIMVVVLLILASITLATLTGDNGIIKKATQAKEETEKAQITELIQLEVLGTYAEEGRFDSEKFKENVANNLSSHNPAISEEGSTIIVTIKDKDVLIDKETGEVILVENSTGTRPQIQTTVTTPGGTAIEANQEYNKIVIGVKVTNKSELDNYEVIIKDSKGNTMTLDSTPTGDADVSCTVEEKGKYTIKVIGTKNGEEKTTIQTITVDNIKPKLQPGQIAEGLQDYTDKNGKTAKIPDGFKVSDVTGENTIDTGLVVIAPDGSEYVWIPVDGVNVKLSRYTFDSTGAETDEGDKIINSVCQELATSDKGNTTAKNIEEFKTSVARNGGYYIGRYEASQGTNNKAVSKKDKTVWNNITQQNAAIACQDIYEGVKSDLINSYAWDTAIVFLQKNDNRADKTKPYSRQNSLNTTLKNTGASGDIICNIYDMASNCEEWTTETYNYSGFPCVYRGGYYYDSGNSTRSRTGGAPNNSGTVTGFRSLLYVGLDT